MLSCSHFGCALSCPHVHSSVEYKFAAGQVPVFFTGCRMCITFVDPCQFHMHKDKGINSNAHVVLAGTKFTSNDKIKSPKWRKCGILKSGFTISIGLSYNTMGLLDHTLNILHTIYSLSQSFSDLHNVSLGQPQMHDAQWRSRTKAIEKTTT